MLAKITTFGGIFPALKPRALPGDAAQTAHNLLMSVPDFRPLKIDLSVATGLAASNPVTMYRLDRVFGGTFNTNMATGWITSTTLKSYAKGPLNSDSTERTYYTFDDGSAPSRWLDLDSNDRRNGVPQPAAAPSATGVVVDEFSTADRAVGVEGVLQTIATTVRDHLTVKWRGATNPGLGTSGYLNVQNTTIAEPMQGQQARLYRLSSTAGAYSGPVANSYTSIAGSAFSWVFDSAAGGVFAQTNSDWPSWTGQSPDHIGFAYSAYGLTYDVSSSALKTALKAIAAPGATAGEKVMTDSQAQAIVDKLVDLLDTTTGEAAAKLSALDRAVSELKALFDGGLVTASTSTLTAYYALGSTTTIVTAEFDTFANRLYDIADAVWRTSVPNDTREVAGP